MGIAGSQEQTEIYSSCCESNLKNISNGHCLYNMTYFSWNFWSEVFKAFCLEN